MHRILILYADHSFRKMVWLALVKLGYEVVEAANTSEAARLHRRLPGDVLIADLRGRCEEDLVQIQAFHRNHLGFRIIQFSPQRRYALESDLLKKDLAEVLKAHRAHTYLPATFRDG